jgi:glycosyltransferase involved in cell wall biosynthesis
MKVALVHDYLNEFGGAERVLLTLAEMYPEAPIYTAFAVKGSAAWQRFKGKKIIESWAAGIPWFKRKLHSPLRFLAPKIWESFDFSGFDLVISSSSWYMTKGIRLSEKTLHVSYIHTPPRYLYGYSTSVNLQKHALVRIYAGLVNKPLRQYDYETAQRVDVLVANSLEVQSRIAKFWRRESQVIYPPVELSHNSLGILPDSRKQGESSEKYYLTGGRLVGPKHFDAAILAANQLKVPLKIFGVGPEEERLKNMAGPTIEFLGKVSEDSLVELYAEAKAFLALADDEDFGITPVEAMMAGAPVVAFRGGGYTESVVEGKTGIFIDSLDKKAVAEALAAVTKLQWDREKIQKHALRFSKDAFVSQLRQVVEKGMESKKRAI